MGSPLRPSIANVSLTYHEQNQLDSCPSEYRPLCYQCYADIFVLLNLSDHLKQFKSHLNCYTNMSFTVQTEQNNKLSFLDANIINRVTLQKMSNKNQLLLLYTAILIAFHLIHTE